ncbi:MAG: hypothetical protein AAB622_03035 [Patescibacteria group bacterium]
MNKKIFGIILGLLLIFSYVLPVSAVCQPWVPSQCAKVRCNIGGTQNCCDSSSECTQQNGTPMQFNPSDTDNQSGNSTGGIDPTCEGGTGIATAIGCIGVLGDQNQYLADILKWAVGVGGGIAFLLIVYAGFMIMSSAGSPDRLKAGQELMTSAISGIVLLVLSIFVLRVIGVDILKIPGFGP